MLGTDQNDGDVSGFHLSGHLTPGARITEGGVQTVFTHGVLQAENSQVRSEGARLLV